MRRLNRVVQLDRFFRTKGGAPYESPCEAELIADFAVYDAKYQAIFFPMKDEDDAVIAQPLPVICSLSRFRSVGLQSKPKLRSNPRFDAVNGR